MREAFWMIHDWPLLINQEKAMLPYHTYMKIIGDLWEWHKALNLNKPTCEQLRLKLRKTLRLNFICSFIIQTFSNFSQFIFSIFLNNFLLIIMLILDSLINLKLEIIFTPSSVDFCLQYLIVILCCWKLRY